MEEKTAQSNTRAFGSSFRENIKPKTTKKSWFEKYDEQKSKDMLVNDSIVDTSLLSIDEKENDAPDRGSQKVPKPAITQFGDSLKIKPKNTKKKYLGFGEINSCPCQQSCDCEYETSSDEFVPQTWDEFEPSPQKTSKKVTFAENLPAITKSGDSFNAKRRNVKKYRGFGKPVSTCPRKSSEIESDTPSEEYVPQTWDEFE